MDVTYLKMIIKDSMAYITKIIHKSQFLWPFLSYVSLDSEVLKILPSWVRDATVAFILIYLALARCTRIRR